MFLLEKSAMNKRASAFVFVLVGMMFLADISEGGFLSNCCKKSLRIRHNKIRGQGAYVSEICKDGHRLPNTDTREDKSCGKTVSCGFWGCHCDQGCRTNDKGNCDDEALRLFLENDGKRLGIGADAHIQYEKGSTPQPCGAQSP